MPRSSIPEATPLPLFCYGTLQLPEVMAAVTGRIFVQCPALLANYTRYGLRGVDYPGIIAEKGAQVEGQACCGIDAATLDLLDRFEGPQYQRRTLTIGVAGNSMPAHVYCLHPAAESLVTGIAWDLARFRRTALARFLRQLQDG